MARSHNAVPLSQANNVRLRLDRPFSHHLVPFAVFTVNNRMFKINVKRPFLLFLIRVLLHTFKHNIAITGHILTLN